MIVDCGTLEFEDGEQDNAENAAFLCQALQEPSDCRELWSPTGKAHEKGVPGCHSFVAMFSVQAICLREIREAF